MRKALALAAVLAASVSTSALAQNLVVGVSWSNFQEERWKTDEAAIKAELEKLGASYISADAQASASKQLNDVDALITQGANALIILAMDKDAIGPAIDKAAAEGIPVVGYDRLIEDNRAFYLTFDNKGVGKLIAEHVSKAKPEGNFAIIKGDAGDPNAAFLLEGMMEVLKPSIDGGKVKIVGEAFSDEWKPEAAQQNMEQILTANDNKVDAVLAENDGMAGGVIAALQAQGLAGTVPVGGQDGDLAALNRVARGTQTVSVWKDSRMLGKEAADIAVALAKGSTLDQVEGTEKWSGGAKGVEMQAKFLAPTPITKETLGTVIDAGVISKAQACEGAQDDVPACK